MRAILQYICGVRGKNLTHEMPEFALICFPSKFALICPHDRFL